MFLGILHVFLLGSFCIFVSVLCVGRSKAAMPAKKNKLSEKLLETKPAYQLYSDLVDRDSVVQCPPDSLNQLALCFLPSPEDIAKELVQMKKDNPRLFQRYFTNSAWLGVQTQYMDHNLVSLVFVSLMRSKHGTGATTSSQNFLARFKSARRAVQRKTDLVLTIEVVEQYAMQLRSCDGDLWKFLQSQKTALEQKMVFLAEELRGGGLLSNIIIDMLNKTIFMLFFIDTSPHSALIRPPPKGAECTLGGPSGGDFVANPDSLGKDATLPFHPDWFKPNVPLFEQSPYYSWEAKWEEKGELFCGFTEATINNCGLWPGHFRQINNDRLLVANVLLTTTLGELKRMNDEAASLQAKAVAVGITAATTVGNYMLQVMLNQNH